MMNVGRKCSTTGALQLLNPHPHPAYPRPCPITPRLRSLTFRYRTAHPTPTPFPTPTQGDADHHVRNLSDSITSSLTLPDPLLSHTTTHPTM